MKWEDCRRISMSFEQQYSVSPEQRELVFKYASKVPKDGVIVELGVCNGSTAAVFAFCAKHNQSIYYGVDNFSLVSSEQYVRNMLNKFDLPYNLLVGRTQDVPWDDNLKIDLLLIDADHSEPGVKADCERWIPLVKSGGIVMFHDFDNTRTSGHAHSGVWMHGDAHTKEWKELDFLEGLMIKQRP